VGILPHGSLNVSRRVRGARARRWAGLRQV